MSVFLGWFDASKEYSGTPVEEEWTLLKRALSGDEIAAARLLLRHGRGALRDSKVQASVRIGVGQVTQHIAMAALMPKRPGGRVGKVGPLTFFQGTDVSGKPGPKPQPDERLAVLIAEGAGLTDDDMRDALKGRPAKLHKAESVLVKYVQTKLFKGASEGVAKSYVRKSRQHVRWDEDADQDVSYAMLFHESRAS